MTTEAPPKADKKQADPFAEKFITPPTQRHFNVVLYGPEGVSKTTGALSAPGPILLANAEGPNSAAYAHTLRTDINEIEVPMRGGAKALLDEAYLWLQSPTGKLTQTYVLDSLSEIHAALLWDFSANPDKPTQPEWGDTNTYLQRYAMSLRDLPINVVIVAHETWIKDDVTGVVERSVFPGTSNVAFGKKFTGPFADIVGYCARVDSDEHGERYMAQLVPANGRHAKNRNGALGKAAEINLTEWFALLGGSEEGK